MSNKIPKVVMSYRKTVASELNKLESILKKTDICHDTSSISEAIRELESDKPLLNTFTEKYEFNTWGYNLDLNFRFLGEPPRHLSVNNLFLRLKVDIYGEPPVTKKRKFNDPISFLTVTIELEGTSSSDNKELITSFHLDKDASDELRPLYHFQFGATRLKAKKKDENFDFGNLLIPDEPRINHYPMDVVLALDFVFNNFFAETRTFLLENNPIYLGLLREKQHLFIYSYYHTIANSNHWNRRTKLIDFTYDALMPELNI